MCMPIEPQFDVQFSDDELRQIQEAAAAGNSGATPGTTATDPATPPATGTTGTTTTPPATGGTGGSSKTEGGMVTEKGNPGESGGLTPAELLNQQLMGQIADLQGSTNLINQQIANSAAGFQSVADGILQGQQMAADALRAGFLDLTAQQEKALKAADDLRKNTGQQQRKPNYSLKLKENAAANRGGISSTMLTGTGGVATQNLTLGRPALLGA